MSANVESIMSVREVPWFGWGTIVDEAQSSADALRLSGLDWKVEPKKIYDQYGNAIPNYIANTRDKDNSVLGIVTERYDILNNEDAFSFTDMLLEEGVKYETAGSLAGGKKIWLLAKMPETKVLNEEYVPYLCFANSFDGTSSVKIALTMVRVVCQNTLNLALKQAKRTWSTKHIGDIDSKMEEAQNTLFSANKYIEALNEEVEILTQKRMNQDDLDEFVELMFPMKEDDTLRKQNNVLELRNYLRTAMDVPDLSQFKFTGYGAINAVTDMVGHMPSLRNTNTFIEKRMDKLIEGHDIVDKAYGLLKVA